MEREIEGSRGRERERGKERKRDREREGEREGKREKEWTSRPKTLFQMINRAECTVVNLLIMLCMNFLQSSLDVAVQYWETFIRPYRDPLCNCFYHQ